MRLEYAVREGVCVLRPVGRFVTGSDAELLSAKNYLENAGVLKAVIDLSGLSYIDSTGLAFVVELHKAMHACGGQLVLAGANTRVREVLRLTKIDGIVCLVAGADEAEAALRGEVLC
jgi:anti-sigma B factor antagonist